MTLSRGSNAEETIQSLCPSRVYARGDEETGSDGCPPAPSSRMKPYALGKRKLLYEVSHPMLRGFHAKQARLERSKP